LNRASIQSRTQLAIKMSLATHIYTVVDDKCYHMSASSTSAISVVVRPTDVSAPDSTADNLLARVHTIQIGDDRNFEVRGQVVDPSKALPSARHGARWIHVPVNDLPLVEVSISDSLAPA
jgi:hypothetical protein